MVTGETKVCPVCDSVIDADAKRCTQCNTDLSLFDVDSDGTLDTGKVAAANGKSIDDILASIVSGKEVRPDIFEDIKTIATNQDDDILADAEVEPGVEFECPNCGTRVAASAKVCPGCGAQFAEEAVEQFECPLCNAVVDVNATACPNCGVAFADEEGTAAAAPPPQVAPARSPAAEPVTTVPTSPPSPRPPARAGGTPLDRLRAITDARRKPPPEEPLDRNALNRELPRLVKEVKPLLLTARKVGVEITNEKDLIGEAITFGKQRDVEKAVGLIRKAQFQLENAFTSQIGRRIESTLQEVQRAQAAGGNDLDAILQGCAEAIDALDARDYVTSAEKAKAAREGFDARAGGSAKARSELSAAKELAANAKRLGVSVREADTYLSRGDAAMNQRNYDQAAGYAVQARQVIVRALPDVLNREMKKARTTLLDMKVKGGDLSKPVGLLKQASIHMKREEYADAVRLVRMFHDEVAGT